MRHPLDRIGHAPVHEAQHVGGILEARLRGRGPVVVRRRQEATEVLLAEGGVVAHARGEPDLRDAQELVERLAPVLRVLVLFGIEEETPRGAQLCAGGLLVGLCGERERENRQDAKGRRGGDHRQAAQGS